jgi:hypothetical protein
MMLSNPSKLGLGDRLQTTCNTVLRTLNTMDKSVDKAESNPERFGVEPSELVDRFVSHLIFHALPLIFSLHIFCIS